MFLFRNFYPIMNLLNAEGAGGSGGGSGGAGNNTPPNDGAGTGTGGTPPSNSGGTGGVSWDQIKASLADDLRGEPSLEPIKDVSTLVKNYIHAQKMVGKASVAIPDAKHATEADWLAIYRKLGAPEKIEDFKFKLPDGVKEEALDKDFLKSIKEAAHASGVMPWQFEKIFGAYTKFASDRVQKSSDDFKAQITQDTNTLKTEWGQAFDTQVKKANIALRELIPDVKDRERLIEDGLGSHPVILKALANAAKYFKEDVFLGAGDGGLAGITPAEALKKANDIMGDSNHPYRKPEHPNHKAAKKEVQDYFKIAYPS